ncbi:MAG: dihydrodipicolinate synthase family protein [Chloroflexota bacterium]
MVDRSMKGVMPILSTPFDEKGRVDVEDLERETEWMIDCGVHGVGIAVASEVYKLTDAERDLVLDTVVKQARGRIPVVMNTGAQGTDVAIYYSERAQERGADALMIRPPTFTPVPAPEIEGYFLDIAKSVSIPIFMQDQSTAQVPPGMAVKLAEKHENLCYVKVESPPTVPRMAEAASLRGGAADSSGLILFGGAGGAFVLEEFRRGSVGTMPGATMPDMFVRVWNAWQAGEHQKAQQDFWRHAPLIRTLAQSQGIANWIYKEILVRRGVFKVAYARRPAVKPDKAQIEEVEEMLDELGLRGGKA